MIAEDFGPVYTRAQKTREGTASAVCNRHDRWHRGQLLETMSSFDAEKRPGEKCGLGTWEGGREKVPAAICRKVIQAKATGNLDIEIWGDGKQTRSFMYIDDCLKGTRDIMGSDIVAPINLGSSELTTINGLVDVVEEIAGVKLKRHYKLDAPKGVNGRNSDNSMIQRELGWAPSTRLHATASNGPSNGSTMNTRRNTSEARAKNTLHRVPLWPRECMLDGSCGSGGFVAALPRVLPIYWLRQELH